MSRDSNGDNNHKEAEFRIGVVALVVALATAIVSGIAIYFAHSDSMRALRLSNRPYVSVQASLVTNTEAALHFSAMGASPALDVVVERRCMEAETAGILKDGTKVVVPPPEVWGQLIQAVSHSVMFPGSSIDLHSGVKLSNHQSEYVFCVGDVAYKDVFGDSHKTTFCFENIAQAASSSSPLLLLPCSDGNRME